MKRVSFLKKVIVDIMWEKIPILWVERLAWKIKKPYGHHICCRFWDSPIETCKCVSWKGHVPL